MMVQNFKQNNRLIMVNILYFGIFKVVMLLRLQDIGIKNDLTIEQQKHKLFFLMN